MKLLITESQYNILRENIQNDIGERSRSFAFTRKKRLYSKPERMSNPLRYKSVDRLEEDEEQKNNMKKKEKDSKFLTCSNCKKRYTQTIYKGKKSIPVCPYCGTYDK